MNSDILVIAKREVVAIRCREKADPSLVGKERCNFIFLFYSDIYEVRTLTIYRCMI